jgi:hypothetical protein
MPTPAVNPPKSPDPWNQRLELLSLDEVAWDAWITKGKARERRGADRRLTALKWATIAALTFTGSVWGGLPTWSEIAMLSLVSLSGMAMAIRYGSTYRKYIAAAVFFAIAMLYNPVFPFVAFAGDWQQRVAVLLTIVPFAMALGRRGGVERHPGSNPNVRNGEGK